MGRESEEQVDKEPFVFEVLTEIGTAVQVGQQVRVA